MRGKSVFKVRTYECGADGRATLPTICNYLQEAASVNAEDLGFSKFPGGGASAALSFRAQKSHIDLNGHVNNVHYVEWMLEPCDSACPKAAEIVFRSETLAGDEVRVECAAEGARTFHRVFAPDGSDHIVAWTGQNLL